MRPSDVPIRWMRGNAARTLHQQWYGSATPLTLALRPLSWIYGSVMRARRHAYSNGNLRSFDAPVPVFSVGNPIVGGAGKTPVSAWLVGELLRRGKRPALLHGGYASDEPELHRRWHPDVPVIAGRDRVVSAQRAADIGCDVVVLDDGMQHLRIRRTFDLALVSADTWRPDARLLPDGPWRESPAALAGVTMVGITRRAVAAAQARRVEADLHSMVRALPPVVHFVLESAEWRTMAGVAAQKPAEAVVALCAIAHPRAFAMQLLAAGIPVRQVLAFPDHHEYDENDARAIVAAADGATVVTTEKDAVKLERFDLGARVLIWRQRAVPESGAETLSHLIDRALP